MSRVLREEPGRVSESLGEPVTDGQAAEQGRKELINGSIKQGFRKINGQQGGKERTQ